MHAPDATLERVLSRDRILVLSGLVCVSVLAWAYLAYLAGRMEPGHTASLMAISRLRAWGGVDLFLLFLMWAVMMVAMMVPTAALMVLSFAAMRRRRHERQQPFVTTGAFLGGYILVWTGFSLLVTLVQWALHSAALLSPMMVSTSPALGGVLLLTAGIFQFSPLKNACLRRCRSPMGFLINEWREGARGALVMGLRHGTYCVGCCWLLMALLFVAGVMNLLWVVAITVFVMIEKLVPRGELAARLAGAALVLAGVILLGQVTQAT